MPFAEQYRARIAEIIDTTQVDEVYVCRNMPLLNETVLHLFQDARKVCYGDGLGYIDINSTKWCKPAARDWLCVNRRDSLCHAGRIFRRRVGKLPLTVVGSQHFTSLMKRITALTESVEESADDIARTGRDRIVIVASGHLLLNGLVASMEDEISLYIECALPLLDRNTTVLVKGHPRERTGQAQMLIERLRALGYDARGLTRLRAIPLECYAPSLRIGHFLPLFSSSAPAWRLLQPETGLRFGVPNSGIGSLTCCRRHAEDGSP